MSVFSEFEVEEIGLKFGDAENYTVVKCVGTSEEEMESRTVEKFCRGRIAKRMVRGTGSGTVTLSLHIPYDLYIQAYGMELETLATGVHAYGYNSRHKTCAMTQKVADEDGNIKYKAYPNGLVTGAKASSIENGAEEVAEVELEFSFTADEYGNGMYEALESELSTELKGTWLTAFDPAAVQAANA